MAYTALYRRFRPRFFKDVVGQEHIIPILVNQVAKSHISHAYLFCGTRGTGKTSTAQILARAIRCENPVDGEPCGVCSVCRTADETGGTVDIIEIDAASNNSVDEVRELRENVRLSPVTGRYKVYIVDEVHMLSAGAFNALLKTLEEPPRHVVFILATTEVHKLPATIVSRCQRFDFKRVSVPVMVRRLVYVLCKIGVHAEDDALVTVARMAQGGMRDALGLLDQCLAAGKQSLAKADVLDILGGLDDMKLKQMADMVIRRDPGGALKALQAALDSGRDLAVLTRDLMQYFRQLMLLSICEQPFELAEIAPEMQSVMQAQAKEAGTAFILRALDILARLEGDMRYSVSARVLAETALIRLCADRQDDSAAALLARIEALEKLAGNAAQWQYDGKTPQQETAEEPTGKSEAEPIKKKPKQEQQEREEKGANLYKRMLKTLQKERMNLYPIMLAGIPEAYEGDVLTVRFEQKNSVFAQAADKEANKGYISSVLSQLQGRPVLLHTVVGDAALAAGPDKACDRKDQANGNQNSQALAEAIALFGEGNIRIMEE